MKINKAQPFFADLNQNAILYTKGNVDTGTDTNKRRWKYGFRKNKWVRYRINAMKADMLKLTKWMNLMNVIRKKQLIQMNKINANRKFVNISNNS